jgi:transposase
LDPHPDGRRDSGRMWHLLPPCPDQPCVPGHPVESATARTAGPSARRGGNRARARRDLAGHQTGAEAQQQTILLVDESGFYPLPSVVRTYAPVGQTPILREWYARDHLSAISAISPEGTRSCHSQDHAMNSADVVTFLEHLLREVPSRMVVIWDGAPIHRSHVVKACLANGASHRIHLEPLPAYAPELNPGEGLWQQLTGVERRHVCGLDIPHLRGELRDAVQRVRRTPRILKGCFQGAGL